MSRGYALQADVSLRAFNTFGVEGRAACLVTVQDAEALPAALAETRIKDLPLICIGDGSNVLFVGDFPGVVLRQAATGVAVLRDDGAIGEVRAEAAVGWDGFVDWSVAKGFAGLENLALIPGRVGAAPIQNIGAYGVELDEFVESVTAWDRITGDVHILARAECGFGYRDSRFKRETDRWIVMHVELRLPKVRELKLDYAGVREEL